MFEFLFKRQGTKAAASGDKPAAKTPAAAAGSAGPGAGKAGKSGKTASTPAPAPAVEARAALAQARERQAAQLAQLGADEAAAVDFILQSEFSELRLAAAELVHERAHLERVHGAMRNLDRRVAKLVQGRLDAIRHHESELRRAEEALAQARSLLGDALLTPNHVAELDRKWSVIREPELAPAFDAVRAHLGERLA